LKWVSHEGGTTIPAAVPVVVVVVAVALRVEVPLKNQVGGGGGGVTLKSRTLWKTVVRAAATPLERPRAEHPHHH
jgi:hypothetical protein